MTEDKSVQGDDERMFGMPRDPSQESGSRAALPVDRQVPHNRDAEEAILGSLLIDPDAYFNVIDVLSPRDFYIERNAWVYEAIAALYDRREVVDFVTLCDELEKVGRLEEAGGAAYITSVINIVPTSLHVEHYAHIVKTAAVRRRLIAAAGEIAALGYREDEPLEETIDQAEQAVFAISQRHLTAGVVSIQDGLSEFYDRVDELHRRGDGFVGLPTSFVRLDKILGGLQRSDLIIVAGRPAMGKTSLVLNIAQNAARMGQRVLLFSLEMSNEQLIQRLVAAEMGVGTERLRVGNLDADEWPKFGEAVALLGEHDFLIDDTPGLTAMQMRARCRRFHAHEPLDLVIVDYLQLMQGERRSENRTQEISYISRMLKNLARELNVPVLAASQLSRAVEQRHDKRPMLSDLRESGCLTGDALVQMASGDRLPIRDLAQNGFSPMNVIALNQENWKFEVAEVRKAWKVGVQPVLKLTTQMEHEIRATANHKFRTLKSWKRLDGLVVGDYIVSRQVDSMLCEQVVSIKPDGIETVYDLEVPGHRNFVANGIVVHNSIEQDSDVVMFIYRDEVYNPETPLRNVAEIIVSKHRHGPTGTVEMFFERSLTRFRDLRPGQFVRD